MVKRIQGTIDYENHNEILNDNHKILIYLDDMTLTGKKIQWEKKSQEKLCLLCRYCFTRWFLYSKISYNFEINS